MYAEYKDVNEHVAPQRRHKPASTSSTSADSPDIQLPGQINRWVGSGRWHGGGSIYTINQIVVAIV